MTRAPYIKDPRFLLESHPDTLALEIDPDRNGTNTAANTRTGSATRIWWRCVTGKACQHSWITAVNNRTHPTRGTRIGKGGCPACANFVVNNYDGRNSMAVTHPELSLDFDYVKNAEEHVKNPKWPATPETALAGSNFKLWWTCRTGAACGHSWQNKASHRSGPEQQGCRACSSTHSASEHLSNVYLKNAIESDDSYGYFVDINPSTSRVHNPLGRDFQVDARVIDDGHLSFVYFYDGTGGHADSNSSREKDAQRRVAFSSAYPSTLMLCHRHGVVGLGAITSMYKEFSNSSSASVLSGIRVLASKYILGVSVTPDIQKSHAEALRTWAEVSKADPRQMNKVLKRERKALTQEGLL